MVKCQVRTGRPVPFGIPIFMPFLVTCILYAHTSNASVFLHRSKFHKLKYGTELNQGDMNPPMFDDEENGKGD